MTVASRFGKAVSRSLGVRVDDALYVRLEKYGVEKDLSVSEAIRALIEIGLDHALCGKS